MLRRLLDLLERMAEENPRRRISWLIEAERLQVLLRDIAAQIGEASEITSRLIIGAQTDAVAMATAAAFDYYEAEGGALRIGAEWNRLPAEATKELVGRFSDGSPLVDAFEKYPAQGVAALEEELTVGIAQGKNPRDVARQIRRRIDVGVEIADGPGALVQEQARLLRGRSELIARTEIVGSHRAAAVANYRANFESCIGYRRLASLDTRTCVACWALHGRVYPLYVDPHEHPQCRCAVAPVFESSRPMTSGVEEFENLSEAAKEEILGPAKFEAYKAGEFGIRDYAATFDDAKWGPQVREQSLRRLRAG